MKYVCELCGSIYDEEAGDIRGGIRPGTPFDQLPEDYACPGCGFLKEAFDPVRPGKQTRTKKEAVEP